MTGSGRYVRSSVDTPDDLPPVRQKVIVANVEISASWVARLDILAAERGMTRGAFIEFVLQDHWSKHLARTAPSLTPPRKDDPR